MREGKEVESRVEGGSRSRVEGQEREWRLSLGSREGAEVGLRVEGGSRGRVEGQGRERR